MSGVSYDAEGPPFGPIVNGTQIVFYHYLPSQEAGWTFVVIFGLATLIHIFLLFKLRAWHFLPLILGTIGRNHCRGTSNPGPANCACQARRSATMDE